MQQLLKDLQSQVGAWVGSSMIHMGDHNVPNALTFIDKYNQVRRLGWFGWLFTRGFIFIRLCYYPACAHDTLHLLSPSQMPNQQAPPACTSDAPLVANSKRAAY